MSVPEHMVLSGTAYFRATTAPCIDGAPLMIVSLAAPYAAASKSPSAQASPVRNRHAAAWHVGQRGSDFGDVRFRSMDECFYRHARRHGSWVQAGEGHLSG